MGVFLPEVWAGRGMTEMTRKNANDTSKKHEIKDKNDRHDENHRHDKNDKKQKIIIRMVKT